MNDDTFDKICSEELNPTDLNPLKMMRWSTFYDMISANLHENFNYMSFREILEMDTNQLRDVILNCVVMWPDESIPVYKLKAYRWIMEVNMYYKAVHKPDRNVVGESDSVDKTRKDSDEAILIPENIHLGPIMPPEYMDLSGTLTSTNPEDTDAYYTQESGQTASGPENDNMSNAFIPPLIGPYRRKTKTDDPEKYLSFEHLPNLIKISIDESPEK